MTEEYDLAIEEWLGVLAELWTAAGKALEADRLQVYRQSLGEVPLGLLVLASSATRVAETADGGLRPPRLVRWVRGCRRGMKGGSIRRKARLLDQQSN